MPAFVRCAYADALVLPRRSLDPRPGVVAVAADDRQVQHRDAHVGAGDGRERPVDVLGADVDRVGLLPRDGQVRAPDPPRTIGISCSGRG